MALSPSQRIALIREIASRLSVENWSLIDLTLEEFGLPTSSWNGSQDSYLVAMLKGSGDQALIDLAAHCGFAFEADAKPQGIDPPFWHAGMLRLFLSHLATHRTEAAQLQSAFLRYGISCFVAHNDIEPTAEWLVQIETALSTCDSLLAMLHPGFHASNWTDQEVGFAMGRGVPTLAVQYGQAPYGFIGRFQAFAGTGKTPQMIANEVFRALLKHKQTQRRMAEVAVSLFELSGSFQEAKDRMTFVEEIGAWEPSFSTRIMAAAKSNSQISSAFGVPQRVDALAKKQTPEIFAAEKKKDDPGFDPDDEIPF
jgi:TIR domain